MRKALIALAAAVVLLAPVSAQAWVKSAKRLPRPHPIPGCIDIGFDENGVPLIDCDSILTRF